MLRAIASRAHLMNSFAPYSLCASLILFVATAVYLTFNSFPPDGLHYFGSLPWTYWVGLGISLISIVSRCVVDIKSSDPSRTANRWGFLQLLVLAAYIFFLPQLSYENLRYQDVYLHGADVQNIINRGHLTPSYSYSEEFPAAFLLAAISHSVTNMDLFLFFRLFDLLNDVAVVLIYLIGRMISPRYALLAPLAYMAFLWVNEGHFSPQGLAAPLYIMSVWALIRSFREKESRRIWLSILLIGLVLINITNPTSAFFMLTSMIAMGTLAFVVASTKMTKNRFVSLMMISTVIWIGWTAYVSDDWAVAHMEKFGKEIQKSDIKITREPAPSYLVVNMIKYGQTAFIIGTSLMFALFIFRWQLRPEIKIITLGLTANVGLLMITMFADATLLGRNFMYFMLAWCILFVVFMTHSQKSRVLGVGKVVVVGVVVLSLVLIPISRYGSDPTTYIPTSTLYSIKLITERSPEKTAVAFGNAVFVAKYFDAPDGKTLNVYRWSKQYDRMYIAGNNTDPISDHILRTSYFPNDLVIFSEAEKNSLMLKYSDTSTYYDVEQTVASQYNKIMSGGITKIYSRP